MNLLSSLNSRIVRNTYHRIMNMKLLSIINCRIYEVGPSLDFLSRESRDFSTSFYYLLLRCYSYPSLLILVSYIILGESDSKY
jgi:hypothetical protein